MSRKQQAVEMISALCDLAVRCDKINADTVDSNVARTILGMMAQHKLSIAEKLSQLSFAQFDAIGLLRSERWHKTGIHEWSVADWTLAMCGEAGEVANAVKKMKRLECGMQQSNGPEDMAAAHHAVLKEIGDTVAYLSLLAQRMGSSLESCAVIAFNSVSAREGFPEKL
jgi:NTP pyrophosphatase (non-canonical NTP hydrolase)